jgi:tripeptide aminopeptidase
MQAFINRLSEILSIPSVTGNEHRLVNYLCALLTDKGITYTTDDMGNIMATKGIATHYPCLVAHTDTVHQINGEIDVREVTRPDAQGKDQLSLTGFAPDTGTPRGCGGDDKAGVFICLEIMDQMDACKVFLPVSEETGCHGSKAAPAEWFQDVGYIIQFDSPENNTMSETLMGKELYNTGGEFWGKIGEQLHGIQPKRHPYTDVAILGERFELECLNLPAGYYKYHRANEYVVVNDVINGIQLGIRLIMLLGCQRYEFTPKAQYQMI